MQRRLIDQRAGEQRIAMLVQRDGHSAEPVCPLTVQLAFNPDLVNRGLDWFWLGRLLVGQWSVSLRQVMLVRAACFLHRQYTCARVTSIDTLVWVEVLF